MWSRCRSVFHTNTPEGPSTGEGVGVNMVTGARVRTLGVHVMYTSSDSRGSSGDII